MLTDHRQHGDDHRVQVVRLEVRVGDQVPEILPASGGGRSQGLPVLRRDFRRGLQAGHQHVERRHQEDHDEHAERDVAAPQRPLPLAVQAVCGGDVGGRAARPSWSRSCRDLLGAPGHAAQHEERREGQDREHEQADRCAQRDVARLDADLEGVGGEHVRHVLRPAVGQDAHDVEVGEGDDQAEQHGDGDDVAHHRQGDEEQLLQRAGAVDRRRLIELLGHRLQRREIHDHEERRAVPDIHRDGAEPRRSSRRRARAPRRSRTRSAPS